MEKHSNRKELMGIVVSNKMQKTIVVRVQRVSHHNKYDKAILMAKKFKVHDEKNIAKIDDVVRIEETRPLSKEKSWRLIEVVKKADNIVENQDKKVDIK